MKHYSVLLNESIEGLNIKPDGIYVDGNDISGLSTSVIKDRKILADNGMVAVVICIDSRINKILCKNLIKFFHFYPSTALHPPAG